MNLATVGQLGVGLKYTGSLGLQAHSGRESPNAGGTLRRSCADGLDLIGFFVTEQSPIVSNISLDRNTRIMLGYSDELAGLPCRGNQAACNTKHYSDYLGLRIT